jgi:hypothetical protein
MSETEQMTCGKGLAANAAFPAKLAEVLDAQADVLERHLRAIDRADSNAAAEVAAYTQLSQDYRAVASELARLAEQMASYRDLAMPKHDPAEFTGPDGQMEAFGRFVALEQELLLLLHKKLEAEAPSKSTSS